MPEYSQYMSTWQWKCLVYRACVRLRHQCYVQQSGETSWHKQNNKFWEELITYFPLIRHWPHRRRRVQQFHVAAGTNIRETKTIQTDMSGGGLRVRIWHRICLVICPYFPCFLIQPHTSTIQTLNRFTWKSAQIFWNWHLPILYCRTLSSWTIPDWR
jgi:hypothetical protein